MKELDEIYIQEWWIMLNVFKFWKV